MSLNLAKAFGLVEKPHSSITDWVDILTSSGYEDEAYDGIPELVDSINLQGSGPGEASRAIRKKLKHGDAHHQYRALVLLKALVENCGHKFQTTFADGQLTDALKHLASDPGTNQKVKKKLLAVLASWNAQFKSDPSMTLVANLYKQCRPDVRRSYGDASALGGTGIDSEWEKKRAEKEEAKRKAKQEKEDAKERERERLRKAEEERKRLANRKKRPPFDFEKEKPMVLTSIVNASQASSNLINAITLVNPEKESLQTNERVQECLSKAKAVRKQVVRYIQLVENEELIGTLIETNDRIITALEMYDKLSTPHTQEDVTQAVEAGLAAVKINNTGESEVVKLQTRQRAAVERAKGSYRGKDKAGDAGGAYGSNLHPDLQDLSFGGSADNLPPPMRPSANNAGDDSSDEQRYGYGGGSLSDYSDYESSDEETHRRAGQSSTSAGGRRPYVDVSDNSGAEDYSGAGKGKAKSAAVEAEDPFADPFADSASVAQTAGGRW